MLSSAAMSGLIRHQWQKCFLHLGLVLCVQEGGGLIQHHQSTVWGSSMSPSLLQCSPDLRYEVLEEPINLVITHRVAIGQGDHSAAGGPHGRMGAVDVVPGVLEFL